MIGNLYMITDDRAQTVTVPFACPNDEVAKRNFLFGCFGSGTPPSDCSLYRVGTYADEFEKFGVFHSVENGAVRVPVSVDDVELFRSKFLETGDKETPLE